MRKLFWVGSAVLLALISMAGMASAADEPVLQFAPRVSAAMDSSCCVVPGDANHDGTVNVRDITCIINELYHGWDCIKCKGGPWKYPEADANANGILNVQDVSYLIRYLYKNGYAPVCGPMW